MDRSTRSYTSGPCSPGGGPSTLTIAASNAAYEPNGGGTCDRHRCGQHSESWNEVEVRVAPWQMVEAYGLTGYPSVK